MFKATFLRSAQPLLIGLLSAVVLSGCSGPKVWSHQDSIDTQPYQTDWSRAHNLVGLFQHEPEKIVDSYLDAEVFRNRVSNVYKDDRLRVNHYFGFLPVNKAQTPEQAAAVFAEQGLEALKTLYASEGFRVHSAVPVLEKDGTTRYSIFVERQDLDCVVPSDPRLLTTVSDSATCRIDVLTSRDPVTKGNAPTENGFTAVPPWAETIAFGWRVSDTRLASKVWVAKEKTPTDLLSAKRMEKLSAVLPDGYFIYFQHERTAEPLVLEKGNIHRFVEPRLAMEKRIEKEMKEKNSIKRKLGDAAKGFVSPRPGSLIGG